VHDDFESIAGALSTLTSRFDPSSLDGTGARGAVRCLAEIERVAGAAKVLATARLVETGAGPGDDAFRDVDAWLASLSGTSVAAARGVVETARRVQQLPATAEALRAGSLSPTQASSVTSAAAVDPKAEHRLLAVAASSGVKGLRSECDRVVAAAASRQQEQDAYDRIRSQRALRVRSLPDGSRQLEARGPGDRIAQILAALEPYERDLFETAQTTKQVEHPEATAFDALVALAEHSARGSATDETEPTRERKKGGRPLAMVVLHVSQTAYERGWTERGGLCEIEGVGPVPVGVAHRLASDCIMKAVVTDGVDITRVAHLGRSTPAHLRTGVETRDRVCVIAGCEVDRHLEIDHNIPHAIGGPASMENLARPCHYHHDLKTRHDLRRVGPLGQQRLVTKEEFERLQQEADRGPPGTSP
jgi:hypothetical protein